MSSRTPSTALALVLLAAVLAAATAQTEYPMPTFGTGPKCLWQGMKCKGAGVLDCPCCDLDRVACMPRPGKEGSYCDFKNEKCLETTSRCDNSDKPCCDKDAVCSDVPSYDGKSSKGKVCEKTCYADDRRCGGAHGYAYVKPKVCIAGSPPDAFSHFGRASGCSFICCPPFETFLSARLLLGSLTACERNICLGLDFFFFSC
jgi:hypothetical protein